MNSKAILMLFRTVNYTCVRYFKPLSTAINFCYPMSNLNYISWCNERKNFCKEDKPRTIPFFKYSANNDLHIVD